MEHNKTGQAFSLDLMIAVSIFSVVMLFLIIFWDDYTTRLNNNLNKNKLLNTAFQFSDYLVKNPGFPTNWDSSNVQLIGIAASDRNISESKFDELQTMTYENTKAALQMNMNNYEYLLNITNLNDVEIDNQHYGTIPSKTAKEILRIRRVINYKNAQSILYVTLWK